MTFFWYFFEAVYGVLILFWCFNDIFITFLVPKVFLVEFIIQLNKEKIIYTINILYLSYLAYSTIRPFFSLFVELV